MKTPRKLLLSAAMAAALASPALAQTAPPVAAPGKVGAQSTASIPDFSGVWRHGSLPWFIPPASGPGPVTNRSRRKDNGQSNYGSLVGDYTNPILQPWAAEDVKKHGELSLAGIEYGNPANQCWPEPLPFIYKNFAIELLQQPDKVTILYEQDHEFRTVRLNEQHPAQLAPSWYGDSVGHYEGNNTLVVDTVGQKHGPFAMIDLYGTPYTDALHVVERYSLLDYDDAKEGLERDAKENFRPPIFVDRKYRGKYLQIYFTVEDKNVFTTPWSATITYSRGSDQWPETVCAENTHEYYNNKDSDVPAADKPDF